MRRLLLALVALALATAPVWAGPNEGGVIVVHDAGIVYTSDLPLPPESLTPTCEEIVNQVAMGSDPYAASDPTIWKVYAAFPPTSAPRLKGCGWGIGLPSAGGGQVLVLANGAPSTEVFYLTSAGWPADNTFIGMSFTDYVRVDLVNELFYFGGYAYAGAAGEPQSFCIIPHSGESNRYFLDDAVPQHADPIADYGCLGFGQPGYTPCPHDDTTGACCFPDGTCTVLTPAECVAAGGSFIGGECLPGLCTPLSGACCFSDGQCVMDTAGSCQAQGGAFQGTGTDCTPNPCTTTVPGACCLPTGYCYVAWQQGCIEMGGSFIGGDCTPDLCPVVPYYGACCFADGHCTVGSAEVCASAGGVFMGDGTSCTPNPCSVGTPGACCFPSGTCIVLTEASCATAGGSFVGGDCTPGLCPNTIPGACCFADFSCLMLPISDCGVAGGTFVGGACTPNPCLPPVPGACCFPDETCAMLLPPDCLAAGGVFYGGECTPGFCVSIGFGACCFVDGTCTLLTPTQCGVVGGYYLGGDCTPNPCPIGVYGACCDPEDGSCVLATEAQCADAGGYYLGDGVSCEFNPCAPVPIERKSWGQIKNSYR